MRGKMGVGLSVYIMYDMQPPLHRGGAIHKWTALCSIYIFYYNTHVQLLDLLLRTKNVL